MGILGIERIKGVLNGPDDRNGVISGVNENGHAGEVEEMIEVVDWIGNPGEITVVAYSEKSENCVRVPADPEDRKQFMKFVPLARKTAGLTRAFSLLPEHMVLEKGDFSLSQKVLGSENGVRGWTVRVTKPDNDEEREARKLFSLGSAYSDFGVWHEHRNHGYDSLVTDFEILVSQDTDWVLPGGRVFGKKGRENDTTFARAFNNTIRLMNESEAIDPNNLPLGLYVSGDRDAMLLLEGDWHNKRLVALFPQMGMLDEDGEMKNPDQVFLFKFSFDENLELIGSEIFDGEGEYVGHSHETSGQIARKLLPLFGVDGRMKSGKWQEESESLREEIENQIKKTQEVAVVAAEKEAAAVQRELEKRTTMETKAIAERGKKTKKEVAENMVKLVSVELLGEGFEVPEENEKLVKNLVKILSVEEYDGENWREDLETVSVDLTGVISSKRQGFEKLIGVTDKLGMKKNKDGEWELYFEKSGEEVKLNWVNRINILLELGGVRDFDFDNQITGRISTKENEEGASSWSLFLVTKEGELEFMVTSENDDTTYKVSFAGKEYVLEENDWFYHVAVGAYKLLTGSKLFDEDLNLQPMGTKFNDPSKRILVMPEELGGVMVLDKKKADLALWGVVADVIDDCVNGRIQGCGANFAGLAEKMAGKYNDPGIKSEAITKGIVRMIRELAKTGKGGGYFGFDHVELGDLKVFEQLRFQIEAGNNKFVFEFGGDLGGRLYQIVETVHVEETQAVVRSAWEKLRGMRDVEGSKKEIRKNEEVGLHPVMEQVFLRHLAVSPISSGEDFNRHRISVIREFMRDGKPGIYAWGELADFKKVVKGKDGKRQPSEHSNNNPILGYQDEDLLLASSRYILIDADGVKHVLRHVSSLTEDQKENWLDSKSSNLVGRLYRSTYEEAPESVWVLEDRSETEVNVRNPRNRAYKVDGVKVKELKGKVISDLTNVQTIINDTGFPVLVDQPGKIPEKFDVKEILRSANLGNTKIILLWQETPKVDWAKVSRSSSYAPRTYGAPQAKSVPVKDGEAWKVGVNRVLDGTELADQTKKQLLAFAQNWSSMSEVNAKADMYKVLEANSQYEEILKPIFESMMSQIFPKKSSPKSKKTQTQTMPKVEEKSDNRWAQYTTVDVAGKMSDSKLSKSEKETVMEIFKKLKNGEAIVNIIGENISSPEGLMAIQRLLQLFPENENADEDDDDDEYVNAL